MSDAPVLVTQAASVATVTLNRPEVHNAFDGATIEALLSALDACAGDPAVRVVVLAGAGRSFCAGADLRWMATLGASGDNSASARTMGGLFGRIEALPKPVIARVHGAVRGGGTGLMAACDIVVATERASFQFSEVRLGLAPAVISPYLIGRIGVTAARELFVTGDRIDAARAHALGLVNHVVADEAALDAQVAALCASIKRGGPQAVGACKALALTVTTLDDEARFTYTSELIARLRASPEGQEGMKAFITKRDPAWVAAGEAE